MNKEVKYIGFYDIGYSGSKRVSSLAAINKMDYICDTIIQAGFNVHIISPSWFDDNNHCEKYQAKTRVQVNEHKQITLSPSFSSKTKISRYFKIVLSLTWLFFWLTINVRKNENIIVYHTPWLSIPIRWAKMIKKFKLILEVEEIYGQVWETSKILQTWEGKLLKVADSYIAVSDVLAKILGPKVRAIVYGNYSIPKRNIDKQYDHLKNNKINVVYAGSVDKTRGGAYNAVKCARLLSDNYIIHISGSANLESINNLNRDIAQVNKELSRDACIYHGLIPDDHFSDFLFSCQIALNPQYDGENMTTLFPSKIIKYLSHNLRIVSTPIKSVKNSKVAELIDFSEGDQPEDFAKSIMSINLENMKNNSEIIRKLDEEFIKIISDIFSR